jgi:hypothetical protein
MERGSEIAAEQFWPYQRPAVVVGHPGHELRVLGWLAQTRPRVHVLTDGSGAKGLSRLPSTSRLLDRMEACRGEVFGLLSDAEIYQAILGTDIALFCSIVDRLAASLAEHGTDFVAADAAEGFNPTHDICRQIADAAIYRAQMQTGRSIANYEFLLMEWDLKGLAEHGLINHDRVSHDLICHDAVLHDYRCRHLRLENKVLRLKLEAARDYAELREEVEHAIAAKGEEYFRIECLRKVTCPFLETQRGYRPYYEQLGEERVASGTYRSAIRYELHMAPILKGIQDYALRHEASVGAENGIKEMNAVSSITSRLAILPKPTPQ